MTDALLLALRQKYPCAARPPASKFWFYVDDDAPRPMVADIQAAVARHFRTTVHELKADGRQQILARHIGMYLSRSLTLNSHERIAKLFNRCDHSVSIWACRKIAKLVKSDFATADHVATLEAQFR